MKTITATTVKFYYEHGSKQTADNVFAYFPKEIADREGNATCYSHIGQHSACSKGYIRKCKPASPEMFAALKKELESIGYELKVLNK